MKFWKRWYVVIALEVAAICLLHGVLIVWLAEKNIVAAAFSAGGHLPWPTMAAAGAFTMVRLLAVLLLPGIVLARIGTVLVKHWTAKGTQSETGDPRP